MTGYKFEAIRTGLRQSPAKDGSGSSWYATFLLHPEDMMQMKHFLTEPLGSRYMLVAVKINDQDEPEESAEQIEQARTVQSAVMLCKTNEFQEWLAQTGWIEDQSEEAAKHAIYEICGVDSRAKIPHTEASLAAFTQMRAAFKAWMEHRT